MNDLSFMGQFSAAPEGPSSQALSLSHQLEILSLAVASPYSLDSHSCLSLPQELLPRGKKCKLEALNNSSRSCKVFGSQGIDLETKVDNKILGRKESVGLTLGSLCKIIR